MANYVLSPDGYSVVRTMPLGNVSAASLTIALPGGYTTTAGSGGSLTTSSYMEAFAGDRGGATIQALYTNTGLTAGQSLEWVQVITTNDPLSGSPGTTITYLDNGALPLNPNAPNFPFYTLTAANRQPTLAPTSLNFYDFSKRASTDVDLANPITWNANLYPVIVNGTSLTVENGISWGWTMKKAMVGTDSGIFTNPVNGTNNIGVGTNTFSWGVPAPDQSSISFAPTAHFDTKPNTPFVLGSLTFHNGTISSGTGADAVTFDDSILFDNVPEKNFDLKTTFTLINTPNVTGDPHLDADSVQIGSFGYTFNVDEGATASVKIMAQLSTGLNVTPSGTSSGASPFPLPTLDPNPNYTLTIVGLAGPSTGGDVTNAPSTFAIAATDADKVALPTGTTAYTLAVTRGGDLSQAAALSYTVAGNGSNPAPQALFANPNGTVNFAAGQTLRS